MLGERGRKTQKKREREETGARPGEENIKCTAVGSKQKEGREG